MSDYTHIFKVIGLDIQEIMRVYNQYERIAAAAAGYEKYSSAHIVKLVSSDTYGSHIAYFNLSSDVADAAIKNEIAYFEQIGKPFEWKTYDTDLPSDIGERLLAQGFQKEEPEAFMVLPLDTVQQTFDEPHYLVEVSDHAGITDAFDVQEQVWGGNQSARVKKILAAKTSAPDDIAIFVIYENEKPVSSAWMIYNGVSPFASMWGGSTIESCRGRGYYSALLHKRINDAKKKGKQYLTIDASAMSRPIVEKHGFKLVSMTTPYTYG